MSETWQGIRVALDELEAADADPAVLGDLLVLYGATASAGERNLGDEAFEALVAAGWQGPPRTPDVESLPHTVDDFLARLAAALTATVRANQRGALRLRLDRLEITARWVRE